MDYSIVLARSPGLPSGVAAASPEYPSIYKRCFYNIAIDILIAARVVNLDNVRLGF